MDYGLVILLVLVVTPCLSSKKPTGRQLCRLFRKGDDSDVTVRLMGVSTVSLYILFSYRDQYYVYEWPRSQLELTIIKFLLTEPPTELEQKWLLLAQSAGFKNFKSEYEVGFSIIDSKSAYLLFAMNTDSVTWDVMQEKFVTPAYSRGNYGDKKMVFISTDTPQDFYVFETFAESEKKAIQFRRFFFLSRDISNGDSEVAKSEKSDKQICKTGNPDKESDIYFESINAQCQAPFVWPLLYGVALENKFYFFGPESVLILSRSVPDKTVHSYESIDTMDFFVCESHDEPRDNIQLIAFAVLGILVIFLLLVVALQRCAYAAEYSDKQKSRKSLESIEEKYEIHTHGKWKANWLTSKNAAKAPKVKSRAYKSLRKRSASH